MTALLAHQGGWDELVLLVGPLVVVAVLIYRSRRRDDEEGETGETGDQGGPDDR